MPLYSSRSRTHRALRNLLPCSSPLRPPSISHPKFALPYLLEGRVDVTVPLPRVGLGWPLVEVRRIQGIIYLRDERHGELPGLKLGPVDAGKEVVIENLLCAPPSHSDSGGGALVEQPRDDVLRRLRCDRSQLQTSLSSSSS